MREDRPADVVDLHAAITELGRVLRRMAGERILLRTKIDPRLGRVEADPGEIHWAFVYLAMNASDAAPSGGELTLAAANIDLDEAAARHLKLPPGPYIRIAFTVTGGGMLIPDRAREIIRRAQGAVFVAGERGSTVSVVLPRARGR